MDDKEQKFELFKELYIYKGDECLSDWREIYEGLQTIQEEFHEFEYTEEVKEQELFAPNQWIYV